MGVDPKKVMPNSTGKLPVLQGMGGSNAYFFKEHRVYGGMAS